MNILSLEQLDISMRVVTIIGPVAMYFLLLGLLNTRHTPQLLTGRQDFAMLTVAMSPLALQPMSQYFGGGVAVLSVCAILLFGLGWLLAPKGRTLVIYNMSIKQARLAVLDILDAMGQSPQGSANELELPNGQGVVKISSFPLLRNVSLRMTGQNNEIWQEFEINLADNLGKIEAQVSPMAVSLLLIATGMLVAPLVMVAHHGPEIVRVLTDLLQ